jgi:hypothetical protein
VTAPGWAGAVHSWRCPASPDCDWLGTVTTGAVPPLDAAADVMLAGPLSLTVLRRMGDAIKDHVARAHPGWPR